MALKPGDLDLRGWTLSVERAINLGRIKTTKTHERRTGPTEVVAQAIENDW